MNKRTSVKELRLEQHEFDDKIEKSLLSFYDDYVAGKTVCGRVIEYNPAEEKILVKLSSNVYGILPYQEATIYKLGQCQSGKAPEQIATLLGKVIHCKIIDISFEEKRILLSRKQNMMEALDILKENLANKPDDIYQAIAISEYKNSTFIFETYEGIRMGCHITQISATLIKLNPLDERLSAEKLSRWFGFGRKVRVKILDFCEREFSFYVSVKAADTRDYIFYLKRKYYFQWKRGEKLIPLKIKIADPIIKDGKTTGYYCEVSPAVTGILNVQKDTNLQFASIVEAKLIRVGLEERKIYLVLA